MSSSNPGETDLNHDGDAGPAARTPRQRLIAATAFGGAVATAAVGGALVGPRSTTTRQWFDRLDKPGFQPPDSVFGPVWSALYPMIAIAGWRVWDQPDSPERDRALRCWTAQIVTNAAWTPVFFGLKRPRLALGVLAVQLAATAATLVTSATVDRPAGALLWPYLAWSSFAFALNADIARRN